MVAFNNIFQWISEMAQAYHSSLSREKTSLIRQRPNMHEISYTTPSVSLHTLIHFFFIFLFLFFHTLILSSSLSDIMKLPFRMLIFFET